MVPPGLLFQEKSLTTSMDMELDLTREQGKISDFSFPCFAKYRLFILGEIYEPCRDFRTMWIYTDFFFFYGGRDQVKIKKGYEL